MGAREGGGHHVCNHTHIQEKAQALEDAGDAALIDLELLETQVAEAIETNVTFICYRDAGDQVENHWLAHAIRANKAKNPPLFTANARL